MNEVKTWPSPDFAVTQNIGHDWIVCDFNVPYAIDDARATGRETET